MPDPANPAASQTVSVFAADMVCVTEGVATGDAISFADELVLDDTYQLAPDATPLALTLAIEGPDRGFVVDTGSATGASGRAVHLDCCLTLMGPDSTTLEALVLVEVEAGTVAAIYLLPLAPLVARRDYRLVRIDRQTATTRLAEIACGSFARGTRITMASGGQKPIEEIGVGDTVLTRDDGPQIVRWVGQTTLRAVGEFAPVVVTAGALYNAADLVLAPDHRVFVYQRRDRLGAGRSEVLVKVRHLVNGTSVRRQPGGFVDYFQILFDAHQIVYAEGIAAESLLIDPRTRAALPAEIASDPHAHRDHLDYEVQAQLLSGPDAVALLRRAASG